jgi:hypothetical protein
MRSQKSIDFGSPPCSPQTPSEMSVRAMRPFSTAMRMWDHDLRVDVVALFLDQAGRVEDRAHLHGGDLEVSDREPHAVSKLYLPRSVGGPVG